eukprot:1688852-Ditylum_brightwellii.AAC.1
MLNHSNRDEVDNDAVIKAAQQRPEDVDLLYAFTQPEEDKCFLPHQAIMLGLPCDVSNALNSTLALKKIVGYGFEYNASLEVVDLLLNKNPDATRLEEWTHLHEACMSGAAVEVVHRLLEVCPNAAKETDSEICYRTPLKNAI